MKYSKEELKKRDEILSDLPNFINQLILLLSSGSNLEDSLNRICESFINEKSFFKREMYLIYQNSIKTGENIVILFSEFAKRMNIKELNRVSNVMLENRLKGVELWDKLRDESNSLWDERRNRFIEKTKELDSKMAFPLALMLLSLIIISIAPALMEIN